ncbi:hypothetical protein FMM68_03355 [Lachnospiraceae bacterium MD329]|nr:hypothetical protein [Lachnospiraceae bacterium MD329]
MEKDFLKKYESEIKEISHKLIDSDKRWMLVRISKIWKDILDEVCKYNIDISVCIKSGYLPVHISSTYLREENIYENLLFIFKKHTSEILLLLTYSEDTVIDSSKTNDFINKLSTKNKLKEFFSEFTQHNVDMLTLLNVTKEISKNINILEFRLRKADIDNIHSLFNIIEEKEMLTLFGYYLYVHYYRQYLLSHKYYSIINLVCDTKKINVTQVRAVCSFLYSVIFDKNTIPPENILTYTDLSDQNIILNKFEEIENFQYAYTYKNIFDNFVIIDCSEISIRKNNHNLLNIILKQAKKLTQSIIIISKKRIIDDTVLNINFDNLDSSNYHFIQNNSKNMQKYISKFKNAFNKKYIPSWIELVDYFMEEYVEKMSTSIYKSAVIEKYLADRYAPIILALYDFFEFLRNEYYIAQEDYNKFINLCNTIYGAENTQIDISDTNTNIDPIVVFTEAIYELYINNIELFTDDNTRKPFIYINKKNQKELLCFNYIADVIPFIKNNRDKINLYNNFSNIFIEAESTEELLQQIRNSLIEKQLQVVNKNRKDYRIGSQSYFALDVAQLKEFVAQRE